MLTDLIFRFLFSDLVKIMKSSICFSWPANLRKHPQMSPRWLKESRRIAWKPSSLPSLIQCKVISFVPLKMLKAAWSARPQQKCSGYTAVWGSSRLVFNWKQSECDSNLHVKNSLSKCFGFFKAENLYSKSCIVVEIVKKGRLFFL